MTDDLITRAEVVFVGVTDGPWGSNIMMMFGPRSDCDDQPFGMVLSIGECDYDAGRGLANSRFNAASRQLVPELLAALKDAREALNQAAAQYRLTWIAGARPPMYPEPIIRRATFLTETDAWSFFRNREPDAQFVSLKKLVTINFEIGRAHV